MSIKNKIFRSVRSRRFDVVMIVVILLSIINYSIGTIKDLPLEVLGILEYVDILFIVVFTIEYFARIITARKKLSYIFSFYGIVDLLSILPFYLGLFFDGEFIKTLRFLKVFRLLKLTRYTKTMQKFYHAFNNSKEEFLIFAFLTIIIFYLASVGIYQFEKEAQPEAFGSVFQSMWWAVATLTTVGYGDIYPITAGGKIFTTIILILGLGIVGVPAGIIAAAFTELGSKDDPKDSENKK